MVGWSKKILNFLKKHRLILILTLVGLASLLYVYVVQNPAQKKILLLMIITLVNLYFGERKFQEYEENNKNYGFVFFVINWSWLIIFFGSLAFWNYTVYFSGLSLANLIMIGLKWRVLSSLLTSIFVIFIITMVTLKENISAVAKENYVETRFESKIIMLIRRKMWIFKYNDIYRICTIAIIALASIMGFLQTFKIIVPYIIQCHVMGTLCFCYIMFLLWTRLKIFYICQQALEKQQRLEENNEKNAKKIIQLVTKVYGRAIKLDPAIRIWAAVIALFVTVISFLTMYTFLKHKIQLENIMVQHKIQLENIMVKHRRLMQLLEQGKIKEYLAEAGDDLDPLLRQKAQKALELQELLELLKSLNQK